MIFQKGPREGDSVGVRYREKLAIAFHLEDPGFEGVTTSACVG